MRKPISRTFKPIVLAVLIFILFTIKDLLTEMVGGKIGEYLQQNYPFITTTRLVYFLLAILFLAFAYTIYEAIKVEEEPKTLADNIEPDIKLFYDSLRTGFVENPSIFARMIAFIRREKLYPIKRKGRYLERYESKLDGRFEITLEVNKDWNFNQPQTFKVNYRENTNIHEAFGTINEAFERQGRLLIVGSPGSGKTVLLLKLAIELLGKDCKADQKLPVIFNLASWSPDYAKFDDWLIDVLNTGNGLSKDFARTLLEQNRIIFLLDGLDELARNEAVETAIEKRAKCLDSLNDYLRMGRKAVICCRREEFAEMQKATNQDAPVSAKVEVLDLGKAEIILALQHAQQDTKSNASATNLLNIIETNDVFLDVLATPFYFTTALEVFDSGILKDKDFSADEAGIKKYLLDRFVDSKLKHTNKLNEFEKDKTKILKWLKWLALIMDGKRVVLFELAQLLPSDLASERKFDMLGGLFVGMLISFFIGIFISLNTEWSVGVLTVGVLIGIIVGSFIGVVGGLVVRRFYNFEAVQERSKNTRIYFFFDIIYWLVCLFVGINFGLPSGMIFGLIIGLIGGISGVLFGGFKQLRKLREFSEIISPYHRMKRGVKIKVLFSLLFITLFIVSLILYQLFWRKIIILNLFYAIVALPAVYSLQLLLFTFMWHHFVLRLCLYQEDKLPLRYVMFLDLAAEARILEKDGGHWRFRHQTLQEHFAKLD